MDAFTRTMRFVGDLDDEFYDDERQRDVWNEASAVGFQLFYWAALVSAAVLPWVAGEVGAVLACGVFAVSAVIGCATLLYSGVRGVNLYTASRMFRLRGVVAAAMILIGFVGVEHRLNPDLFAESSSWAGAITGGVVGGGTVVLMIWLMRRRRDRFENEEI